MSTLITGIFLADSCSRVEAIAPVSCGAITTALAPVFWNTWTLATSLVTSFWELLTGRVFRPCVAASCLMYCA
ncbi:hypothetical protein ADK60_15470 [Streptomyces sp. XY431]|nr:hypothetical protein ADK60_15470 [Streptomyces sp. XY431]